MSATPTIFSVPQPRNPNFVGREDLLGELHRRLTSKHPADRTQVLTGLGGIGKSAIALEYAYRHKDEYGIVWWVRADDELTVQNDLMKLAQRLAVAPGETNVPAVLEALKGRLGGRADWLLIFDHAPSPSVLEGVLPKERSGQVIITSRNPNWLEVRGMAIGPMQRDEAVTLLRKRAAGAKDNPIAIAKLAQALGDVPLALDQAGAMIQQTKSNFEQYLQKFELHWAELLKRGPLGREYPDAVAMVWEISCRHVSDTAPAAMHLLSLLSFFASSGIPRDLITEGAIFLSEPVASIVQDESRLNRALAILKQFSLLEISEDRIYVQGIVATLARRRMSSDDRRRFAKMAVRLADSAFKFDTHDVMSWAACAAILPHVRAAIERAMENEVSQETCAILLNDIGDLLYKQAKYNEARDTLERAMTIAKKVFDPDSSKLRSIGNNLGRVLAKLGELAEAKRQIEIALEAEEEVRGKDHPVVADLLNNYGTTLHKLGDYAKAREIFSRALSIYDLHDLQDEPKAAAIINNLGYVFMKMGNLVGARDLFNKALKLAQKGYGNEHPDVAAILNNIGDLQFIKGDYKRARAYYEQALAIDRAVFGPDHPEVARHLGDLGRVLMQTGDPAAARRYLESALKIEESTFGATHPTVGSRCGELARVLKASGETDQARVYFERASRIAKLHPRTTEAQSLDAEPAPAAAASAAAPTSASAKPAARPAEDRPQPIPLESPAKPAERKPLDDAPSAIGPGIFSDDDDI
jgi:tetratricopeptide (TPR) repeat protein